MLRAGSASVDSMQKMAGELRFAGDVRLGSLEAPISLHRTKRRGAAEEGFVPPQWVGDDAAASEAAFCKSGRRVAGTHFLGRNKGWGFSQLYLSARRV